MIPDFFIGAGVAWFIMLIFQIPAIYEQLIAEGEPVLLLVPSCVTVILSVLAYCIIFVWSVV